MNKIVTITILFSTIMLTVNIIPVSAMPWRQPPPQPAVIDAPIPPPPEEPAEGPPVTYEPPSPPPPTPTPCRPNLCLIEKTSCCFSAMCVFHGEDKNRCPDLAGFIKENEPKDFVTKSIPSFFSLLFGKIFSGFGR